MEFVYELAIIRRDMLRSMDFYVALSLEETINVMEYLDARNFVVTIYRYKKEGGDLSFNGIVATWSFDEVIDYAI